MAAEARVIPAHYRRVGNHGYLGTRSMLERADIGNFATAARIGAAQRVELGGKPIDLDLVHEAADVRLFRFDATLEPAAAVVAELAKIDIGTDGISATPVDL